MYFQLSADTHDLNVRMHANHSKMRETHLAQPNKCNSNHRIPIFRERADVCALFSRKTAYEQELFGGGRDSAYISGRNLVNSSSY